MSIIDQGFAVHKPFVVCPLWFCSQFAVAAWAKRVGLVMVGLAKGAIGVFAVVVSHQDSLSGLCAFKGVALVVSVFSPSFEDVLFELAIIADSVACSLDKKPGVVSVLVGPGCFRLAYVAYLFLVFGAVCPVWVGGLVPGFGVAFGADIPILVGIPAFI